MPTLEGMLRLAVLLLTCGLAVAADARPVADLLAVRDSTSVAQWLHQAGVALRDEPMQRKMLLAALDDQRVVPALANEHVPVAAVVAQAYREAGLVDDIAAQPSLAIVAYRDVSDTVWRFTISPCSPADAAAIRTAVGGSTIGKLLLFGGLVLWAVFVLVWCSPLRFMLRRRRKRQPV